MPANKLTDAQLIVLSTAARRDDRGNALPADLKGGAAQKLVAKLIDLGLVEEVRARGELPAWRRGKDIARWRCASPSAGSRPLEDDPSDGKNAADAKAPSEHATACTSAEFDSKGFCGDRRKPEFRGTGWWWNQSVANRSHP